MTRRSKDRPRRVKVHFRDIDYWMDRVVCNAAVVRRQVEGEFGSVEEFAKLANVSRSTASRFLAGRPTSLATSIRILATLRLAFDEVFSRCQDADEATHDNDDGHGEKPVVGDQR